MVSGGNVYDIDYTNASLVATPGLLPNGLQLVEYTLSEYYTGADVIQTLSLKLDNALPKDGKLIIELPENILFAGTDEN